MPFLNLQQNKYELLTRKPKCETLLHHDRNCVGSLKGAALSVTSTLSFVLSSIQSSNLIFILGLLLLLWMQISDIFAFVPVSTSTQSSRVGAGEISLVWKPESFNNSFNRWVSVLVLTLFNFWFLLGYQLQSYICRVLLWRSWVSIFNLSLLCVDGVVLSFGISSSWLTWWWRTFCFLTRLLKAHPHMKQLAVTWQPETTESQ